MTIELTNPNFPGLTFRLVKGARQVEIGPSEVTARDIADRAVVVQVWREAGWRGNSAPEWFCFATLREGDLDYFCERDVR